MDNVSMQFSDNAFSEVIRHSVILTSIITMFFCPGWTTPIHTITATILLMFPLGDVLRDQALK